MKIGQFKNCDGLLVYICAPNVTHCVPVEEPMPGAVEVFFQGGTSFFLQDRDGFMKWLASDG